MEHISPPKRSWRKTCFKLSPRREGRVLRLGRKENSTRHAKMHRSQWLWCKNIGKSLSKSITFNANKHVFRCEKSPGTLFHGQPSYNRRCTDIDAHNFRSKKVRLIWKIILLITLTSAASDGLFKECWLTRRTKEYPRYCTTFRKEQVSGVSDRSRTRFGGGGEEKNKSLLPVRADKEARLGQNTVRFGAREIASIRSGPVIFYRVRRLSGPVKICPNKRIARVMHTRTHVARIRGRI